MSRFLLLRLEAPLLSFGGTTVDGGRPTDRFPSASLIAGLIGNALGYHHRDHEKLQTLQDNLVHGACCLRNAQQIKDFQTVDLGQEHLSGTGWTSWGAVEGRAGGSSNGTHIRERHFIADARYRVAITWNDAAECPTLEQVVAALQRPARPLFLGRKACLPSTRLVERVCVADTLRDALLDGVPPDRDVELWTPTQTDTLDGHTFWASDRRDWANQAHTGRRLWRHEQRTGSEIT